MKLRHAHGCCLPRRILRRILGEDKHTSWLSSRQQESYGNPMMLNAQAQEYDFVLNQQQRA
jgi:hypothetical protein